MQNIIYLLPAYSLPHNVHRQFIQDLEHIRQPRHISTGIISPFFHRRQYPQCEQSPSNHLRPQIPHSIFIHSISGSPTAIICVTCSDSDLFFFCLEALC